MVHINKRFISLLDQIWQLSWIKIIKWKLLKGLEKFLKHRRINKKKNSRKIINVSNKLKMIYEQLRVKSNNKDDAYDKLTLKKKLKVIHFYEDKIIEVLKLFARN